jgi:hypothetical protein
MQYRLLVIATLLVAACGDSGPDTDSFTGDWRLTSVNSQPLPADGNATGGEVWLGAVLQLDQDSGSFDRCMEVSPGSLPVSRSTAVLIAPIGENRIEVSYFERRDNVPDTAEVDGEQLSLRYRNVIGGEVQGMDELTFVPLTGGLPGGLPPTPCIGTP